MADYRLKIYLDKDDYIDVTCTDKSDDFEEFFDSFSNANFAIFNDGPNGYQAIHMPIVRKVVATKIN